MQCNIILLQYYCIDYDSLQYTGGFNAVGDVVPIKHSRTYYIVSGFRDTHPHIQTSHSDQKLLVQADRNYIYTN